MIIIDFQHLSYRNLYTCLYNVNPKKINDKYDTDEFIGVYFYQMLSSLNKISKEFSEYGEIIIGLDGFHNWRKQIVEREYKNTRAKARKESDVNFSEFFEKQTKFENFLKGFAKVIRIDRAEADDIGFVLAHYLKEKTLLITSDKDWKQHLIDNPNVDFYDPIKDELIENCPQIQNELKMFRIKHILLGDKVDEVPNVMFHTELHKEFINYLNELKLDINTPTELEIFIEKNGDEILQNYNGEIYRTPRFGEKSAEKLISNPTEFIHKKIKDKKKFYKNFHINRKLIDSRKIPKDIQTEIINTYKNTKLEKADKEFLEKYNLQKCYHYKIGNRVIEDCINFFENEFDDIADLF